MPILPSGRYETRGFCEAAMGIHLRNAEYFKRTGKDRGTPQHIIDRLVGDELASAKIYQDALEDGK